MSNTYSANNTAVTGPQSMYELKKLLSGAGTNSSQGSSGGAGWTVLGSSDGTSFNTAASGIDYWQSGSSGTKGCANTNAWVRMQMPTVGGVTREILIQRGSTNTSWRIGYSYSVGFVGVVNGAISATVAPTATDGQALIDHATIPAQGFISGGASFATSFMPTDSTYHFSCMAQSASPYGFWAFAALSTTTVAAVVMDPLISGTYPAADTDPYVFYGASSAAGNLQASVMGGNALITSSDVKCWLKKGLAGEGWVQMGSGVIMINNSGVANKIAQVLGPTAADGNDVLLPVYYGRVASLTAPVGGKGMSSFLQWVNNTRALKDTTSVASAGAKDYIVINDVALPWNGSAPALWRMFLALV